MAGGGGTLSQFGGETPHLTSPCAGRWGVFLPSAQRSGSAALRAARSALAGRWRPSPGAEGRVAKTGLWRVPSEWKFPLPSTHTGEGGRPARKETTSKQLERPPCVRQMCVTHPARVRPARPFPSTPQSDAHAGRASFRPGSAS